jgi:hypothetical protein
LCILLIEFIYLNIDSINFLNPTTSKENLNEIVRVLPTIMNVASLLKISSTGLQDERLTAPQALINDIASLSPKRGRYTTRYERIEFESTPQFGQQATAEIPVKGHLLCKLYLVSTLPDIYGVQEQAKQEAQTTNQEFIGPKFGWTNSVGHALVEEATIDIGGKPIDHIDSRLLEILDEFNTPIEQIETINRLILRDPSNFSASSFSFRPNPLQVCVPLPFWFTRDPAVALPVDAINADIIRLRLQIRAIAEMYYTESRSATSSTLWPILNSLLYSTGGTQTTPQGLETSETQVNPLTAKMPASLRLGETYLIGEYIYLDNAEANRFRIGDIEIPIVQHYALPVIDTEGSPRITTDIQIPNPTRALYWMAQRQDAAALNAHFYACADISDGLWPDAGDAALIPHPAWRFRGGEPFTGFALTYDGYVRARTEAPQLYRSILPSIENQKSPYINKYYYTLSLSDQEAPISAPIGEANLDKIQRRNFYAEFSKPNSPMNVYIWGETFNVLKIYGGRAGLLFAY